MKKFKTRLGGHRGYVAVQSDEYLSGELEEEVGNVGFGEEHVDYDREGVDTAEERMADFKRRQKFFDNFPNRKKREAKSKPDPIETELKEIVTDKSKPLPEGETDEPGVYVTPGDDGPEIKTISDFIAQMPSALEVTDSDSKDEEKQPIESDGVLTYDEMADEMFGKIKVDPKASAQFDSGDESPRPISIIRGEKAQLAHLARKYAEISGDEGKESGNTVINSGLDENQPNMEKPALPQPISKAEAAKSFGRLAMSDQGSWRSAQPSDTDSMSDVSQNRNRNRSTKKHAFSDQLPVRDDLPRKKNRKKDARQVGNNPLPKKGRNPQNGGFNKGPKPARKAAAAAMAASVANMNAATVAAPPAAAPKTPKKTWRDTLMEFIEIDMLSEEFMKHRIKLDSALREKMPANKILSWVEDSEGVKDYTFNHSKPKNVHPDMDRTDPQDYRNFLSGVLWFFCSMLNLFVMLYSNTLGIKLTTSAARLVTWWISSEYHKFYSSLDKKVSNALLFSILFTLLHLLFISLFEFYLWAFTLLFLNVCVFVVTFSVYSKFSSFWNAVWASVIFIFIFHFLKLSIIITAVEFTTSQLFINMLTSEGIYWFNCILSTILPFSIFWLIAPLQLYDLIGDLNIPSHYGQICVDRRCANFFQEYKEFPETCKKCHIEHFYLHNHGWNVGKRIWSKNMRSFVRTKTEKKTKHDGRPDAMAMKDPVHDVLIEKLKYLRVLHPPRKGSRNFSERSGFVGWLRSVFRSFFEMEEQQVVLSCSTHRFSSQVVSQLKTPVNMQLHSSSSMVHHRLVESVKAMHSINYNRFKEMYGENIINGSVLVAFAIAMQDNQRLGSMPFRNAPILAGVSK